MTMTDSTPTLMATLPGAAYTDPAFFALEQEHIFERLWFCAADGRKLTAPGDFVTIEIGRESVIVSRAKDGSLAGVPQRLPPPRRHDLLGARGLGQAGVPSAPTTPGPTTSTAS